MTYSTKKILSLNTIKGNVSRDFPPHSNPTWPPDKQSKISSNLVSIAPRYSIITFENSDSAVCMKPRSQIIWLSEPPLLILKIYSPTMGVFTHKRILPDCSFRSILTPTWDANTEEFRKRSNIFKKSKPNVKIFWPVCQGFK